MKTLTRLLVSTAILSGTIYSQSGWHRQNSGTSNALFAVSFSDANTGTAVGSNGTILRTTDGGLTWISQRSGTTSTLQGVSFSDADNGMAAGSSGIIVRTTDGGETWSSQPSGTSASLYGISSIDAYTGTAVGEGGLILRTTDGGTSWTIQFSSPSGQYRALQAVWFTDASTGLAVGGMTSGQQSADGWVKGTTDGGSTWTDIVIHAGTGPALWLYGITFTGAGIGTAVGTGEARPPCCPPYSYGAILRTNSGGETWGTQSAPEPGPTLYAVAFTDSDTGIAVGGEGAVQRTTNGGVTWTSQSSSTSAPLYGVSLVDANTATAVGSGGTIVRTTTGGVTPAGEDQEPAVPQNSSLRQNYPNPFNPGTRIEYQLKTSASVSLKVFNVLGREVATLVDEVKPPGTHQVLFEGAGLSSGVYFYRLEAGSLVQTRRLVLQK